MSNEQQSSSSFQVIDDGDGNNNGDNHDNNPIPITQFSPQAQAHSKEPEEEEVSQEEEAAQEEAAAIPPEAAAIPPAPVPPQQPPAVALPSTPLARNTASQPSTPAAPFLQSNPESPVPATQRPTPATPSIPSIPEAPAEASTITTTPPATQTARSIDQLLPQASKMEADADLKLIAEMNQEQDDSEEEEFDADVNDPSSVEVNDLLVPLQRSPHAHDWLHAGTKMFKSLFPSSTLRFSDCLHYTAHIMRSFQLWHSPFRVPNPTRAFPEVIIDDLVNHKFHKHTRKFSCGGGDGGGGYDSGGDDSDWNDDDVSDSDAEDQMEEDTGSSKPPKLSSSVKRAKQSLHKQKQLYYKYLCCLSAVQVTKHIVCSLIELTKEYHVKTRKEAMTVQEVYNLLEQGKPVQHLVSYLQILLFYFHNDHRLNFIFLSLDRQDIQYW